MSGDEGDSTDDVEDTSLLLEDMRLYNESTIDERMKLKTLF